MLDSTVSCDALPCTDRPPLVRPLNEVLVTCDKKEGEEEEEKRHAQICERCQQNEKKKERTHTWTVEDRVKETAAP